ncbi:DUF5681 domain-containing protein [Sphingomonas sp. M1-B02]|uniref:DUF5681 domain-containing protein n=1 Tax=Sphingomonas sp. M1-B02 TaxID=3114300 RepID=UPI00223EF224|nr:DUF5681 domain-containing protein [Sphingomonas sp. S6-11]UZK66681.1 DUF5681 domain-containing protein [Sphingomonas sp. S6-11]
MARVLPPEHGRFQKGQSGNPKGRPRKQPITSPGSAFDIVIDRTLTVMQAGVPRQMTIDEALEQRTYQAAIGGDRAAQREIYRMIARHEKVGRAKNSVRRKPVEVLHEFPDSGSIESALQILGVAAPNSSRRDWPSPERHLLLEPWAVKAALRRRGARVLTKRDLDEVRRSTRDADSIVWPEASEP